MFQGTTSDDDEEAEDEAEDEDNEETDNTDPLITSIAPVNKALSKAYTIYQKEKKKPSSSFEICQDWANILKAFFEQDLSLDKVR